MAEQLSYDSSGESLFIPADALRAMRDSRYRNTAYALSELIDNSIDARSKNIDILCFEEQEVVSIRQHWRMQEIAVLDNGHGMNRETLIQALRFGGRRSSGVHRIGKYGMGLPTASVSKARRVDVWTWENGIDNLWHCYIDVEAVESNRISMVPNPDKQSLPSKYIEKSFHGTYNESHGTLVVWTNLDRVTERSNTIFDHIEREIGKIHRHFIYDGDVMIHAASFRREFGDVDFRSENERQLRPNDPLYLMQPTSTPDPWDNDAMFQPYGSPKEFKHHVDGKEEIVRVVYSIVKPEALKTPGYANAGDSPHGQHARRNLGVSVVRERREILLENEFVRAGGSSTAPQNRWWGCEVEFSRGSDDLFGVDHNKQMAANFTQAARDVMNSDDSDLHLLNEFGESDDLMYKIVLDIRNTTRAMFREIVQMMEHRRKASEGKDITKVSTHAARIAKEATQEAIERGDISKTKTDIQREEQQPEQRELELFNAYVAEGVNEVDARSLAKQLIENDEWYCFESDQLDAYQMFRIRNQGGVIRVILNINHPIHDFIRMFEEQAKLDLSDPVRKAGLGLILLLMSWARMEDQIESEQERRRIQFIAQQWGVHVDEFIQYITELQ